MITIEVLKKAAVVCQECGEKYGAGKSRTQFQSRWSTWRKDKCDICGKVRGVTDFRDFGYEKYKETCTLCNGTGHVFREPCTKCNGVGLL